MKSYILIFGILLILAFAIIGFFFLKNERNEILCTQEVKICSDGSAVGRIAPNCEFAKCPETGVLQGDITIGPICPVERPGINCTPGPEVFSGKKVVVYAKDGKTKIKEVTIASTGHYRTELLQGDYVVDIAPHPVTGVGSIAGVPKVIRIESGKTVDVNIDIDTGIR